MDSGQKLLEQILILRSQIGDKQAMAELIGLYQRPLKYFVFRMLKDSKAVEDISQQTWLKIIKKIGFLKKPESFAAWLYSIARNYCYDELRRKNCLQPFDDNYEVVDNTPEEELNYDDIAKLHNCLENLRPEHKEVLMLKFLENMTYEEMSRVTNCNIGTVRSRLFYAKQTLRKEMEKEQ